MCFFFFFFFFFFFDVAKTDAVLTWIRIILESKQQTTVPLRWLAVMGAKLTGQLICAFLVLSFQTADIFTHGLFDKTNSIYFFRKFKRHKFIMRKNNNNKRHKQYLFFLEFKFNDNISRTERCKHRPHVIDYHKRWVSANEICNLIGCLCLGRRIHVYWIFDLKIIY